MKKYLLFIVLYIICYGAHAQEVLVPMETNPVIKGYLSKNGIQNAYRSSAASVPLPLPFIDDFSSTEIYPSALNWIDNKVFINSTFGRVMPSVGVASFDGLDEFGNAYVPGGTNPGSADVLTSQPLQLFTKPGGGNYVLGDNIYISFYYEKQGYGDEPEISDSLVLEFFRPSLQTWTKNWFSLGNVVNGSGQDTVFNKVDILITDASYLQDGFQLRFRSYGNLSGSLDHWHIDYVKVYTAADSLVSLVDQAMTTSRTTALETFTSIPWTHYKNSTNQAGLIKDNSTVNYIIYQDQSTVNAGFAHTATSPAFNVVGSSSSGLFAVPSLTRLSFPYSINYPPFPDADQLSNDSSYFDLKDYFAAQLGGDNILTNDTVSYRQHFYNYYSYDDGTCEAGYDLQGAASGKVAMKFDMLEQDSLRGVEIFFSQQNNDVSNKLINIKVWSSLSPEVVLYQQTAQKPEYIDSINGFANYRFPPIAVTSFYIGFQQQSSDNIHLGFDRNTNSNSKMYYNVGGTWSFVNAAVGSFMIRPLVSQSSIPDHISEYDKSPVKYYPNPTSGSVYISTERDDVFNRITVTDLGGRIVFEDIYKAGTYDFSFLDAGLYAIQLEGKGTYSLPVKLIINK